MGGVREELALDCRDGNAKVFCRAAPSGVARRFWPASCAAVIAAANCMSPTAARQARSAAIIARGAS